MAYTKIHAVKATINKAIAYICNPDKTDQKILIDSFGTGPETAAFDFKSTLSKTSSSDPNLAYHLIQSFAPGEVSYDEAHRIGIELADRLLENKYSYVIATHIDHDHIHNHIVFCAADNVDHKKYHDCKKSYYHIRQLSDELCSEHNLSIIKLGPKRGMKYNEWSANKNGTSWKTQLRNDIDECIKISKNYDNFLELIAAKGYEIKGSETGKGSAKYIALRPLEGKQFVRGSERSLGPGYTKEQMQIRIEENIKASHQKVPFPKKPTPEFEQKTQEDLLKRRPKDPLKAPRSTLIDTTTEKMRSSPGLLRWANIQNLKAVAHAYAMQDTITELQSKIEAKEAVVKASRQSLVSLEKKMKPAAEILHYAEIYTTNLRYHNAMQRSKDPDRYYRDHDTQIILFNAAEHVLHDVYNINPGRINLQHMQDSYRLMEEKKSVLTSTWKSSESELKELQAQLKNLQEYLSSGGAESMQSHVHEENHEEEKKQPEQDKQPKKNGQHL